MTYLEKLTLKLQTLEGQDIKLDALQPEAREKLLKNLKLYEDTTGKNPGFVSLTFSNDFAVCRVSHPVKTVLEITQSNDNNERERLRDRKKAARNK
jgi:hypothetical protein